MTQQYKKGQFFAIQRHEEPTLSDIFPKYRALPSNQPQIFSSGLNSTAEPLIFQPMSTLDFEERIVYRSSPSKMQNSQNSIQKSPQQSNSPSKTIRSGIYISEKSYNAYQSDNKTLSSEPASLESRSYKYTPITSSTSQKQSDYSVSTKLETPTKNIQQNQQNSPAFSQSSSPQIENKSNSLQIKSNSPRVKLPSPPINRFTATPSSASKQATPSSNKNSSYQSPSNQKDSNQISSNKKESAQSPSNMNSPYQTPVNRNSLNQSPVNMKEINKNYSNQKESTQTSSTKNSSYEYSANKSYLSQSPSNQKESIQNSINKKDSYQSPSYLNSPYQVSSNKQEINQNSSKFNQSPLSKSDRYVLDINDDPSPYSSPYSRISEQSAQKSQNKISPKQNLASPSIINNKYSSPRKYEVIDDKESPNPKKSDEEIKKSPIPDNFKNISNLSLDDSDYDSKIEQEDEIIEEEEEYDYDSVKSFSSPLKPPLTESHSVPPSPKAKKSSYEEYDSESSESEPEQVLSPTQKSIMIDGDKSLLSDYDSDEEEKNNLPSIVSPRKFADRSTINEPQSNSAIDLPYYDPSLSVIEDLIDENHQPVKIEKSKSPKKMYRSSPANASPKIDEIEQKSPSTSPKLRNFDISSGEKYENTLNRPKYAVETSQNPKFGQNISPKSESSPKLTQKPNYTNNVSPKNEISPKTAQNPISSNNISNKTETTPKFTISQNTYKYVSPLTKDTTNSSISPAKKPILPMKDDYDEYKPSYESENEEEEEFNDDPIRREASPLRPGAVAGRIRQQVRFEEEDFDEEENYDEIDLEPSKSNQSFEEDKQYNARIGPGSVTQETYSSLQSIPVSNSSQKATIASDSQRNSITDPIPKDSFSSNKSENKQQVSDDDELSLPDIAKKYLNSESDDSDIELPPEAIKYLEEENTQVSLSDDIENSPQKAISGVNITIGSKIDENSIDNNVQPVVSISQCSNVGYNSQAVSIDIYNNKENENEEEDSEEDVDISNIEEILKKYNIDIEEESDNE